MRMLHPSLGHQHPENLEFGEREDLWMGGRRSNRPPLAQMGFCWKRIPGPGETYQSLCPFREQRQSRRPVGPGPRQCSGSGLQGLGRDPIGWGQEGERADRARGDFFSVVLDSVCPQRLFFPSSAKHFF